MPWARSGSFRKKPTAQRTCRGYPLERMSAKPRIVKKTQRPRNRKAARSDMLAEYRFDYRKAKPNRFAGRAEINRLFPKAPAKFPMLAELALRIARAWANDPGRPKPRPNVVAHWDQLISQWYHDSSHDSSLPLFVRKANGNRGQKLPHSSGRFIVPSDNSPAHWALAWAVSGKMPNLGEIRKALKDDKIPVAFAFKRAERAKAHYRCTLSKVISPSAAGWKVAHIMRIGLRSRKSIVEIDESKLRDHFTSFMAPRNMFVIPKAYSGLAELQEMCDEMRKVNHLTKKAKRRESSK